MKAICSFLLLFALTGCESLRKDIYLARQQIYFGSDKIVTRQGYGFSAQSPETWGMTFGMELDPDARSEEQYCLAISSYDKSPSLQCNRLKPGVTWQDDLARITPKIEHLSSKNHRIVLREELTFYRGNFGHGRRWVKTGYFSEDEEIVVFYPIGQLSGCRLYILHIGTPNLTAWQEFDAIIRTLVRW